MDQKYIFYGRKEGDTSRNKDDCRERPNVALLSSSVVHGCRR